MCRNVTLESGSRTALFRGRDEAKCARMLMMAMKRNTEWSSSEMYQHTQYLHATSELSLISHHQMTLSTPLAIVHGAVRRRDGAEHQGSTEWAHKLAPGVGNDLLGYQTLQD